MFNLPEYMSQNREENKRHDEARVKDLSISLGLENPQIQLCFRLGKSYPSKNRPLKVYLLDNAKFISEKSQKT